MRRVFRAAGTADGELLDSMDQGVFLFREELSLHPRPDLFGGDGGTYLFLTGRKSLAELDRGDEENKKFETAMGKMT
jgi:hypothetical protein